ncbi:SPOR domain-containing protein [Neptunicella sp. SCSIO 80796]|uniref:SPOR domain-containing protein n=1 Tax=Neptunicella plasticusilytica TaxID=3117012 RepID=UPI003A4DBB59
MAPKDYVSRGKSAAPSQPEKPPLPWLRIVITTALIAGFGYFLWSIKGTSPQTEQKKDVIATQQQVDPLPEVPKEEWEFIDALDHQNIEVDVPEPKEDSDPRPYKMQCGSFKLKSQAEEMKAKLAFGGLEADVSASNGKNGLWYRVAVGPIEDKRTAERKKHQARKLGIATCQIWRWN